MANNNQYSIFELGNKNENKVEDEEKIVENNIKKDKVINTISQWYKYVT